jgi:hypothetical protein
MKSFQFIHATQLGATSIMVTEEDIMNDITIPQEDQEKVNALDVNEKCLCRFGMKPIKTANVIRRR